MSTQETVTQGLSSLERPSQENQEHLMAGEENTLLDCYQEEEETVITGED